ncbi:MAG: MBL fold metallo-hydrolase [Proteobacteria bacterium]|nr:MBL fold metallo-hydrolase [Pseudomonadota bacterium]
MRISRRKSLAALAAVATFGVAGGATRSVLERYYDGPASDHFDGARFFDPHGMPPKSLAEVARWLAAGGKARWPKWAPSPYSDSPPARVEGRAWRISYVGHASFLLQTAGLNILIDPVWSERASPFGFIGPRRVNAPGIAFDALPPIDVVLVSHNHYDHLDVQTLSALAAAHRARVLAPLGNDAVMAAHDSAIRVEAHDWETRVELARDVGVTLVASRHWSGRGPLDRNKALWAAFVIDTPAGRIFHVADSGYGDGWHFRTARERHGPFRLAILPVGAYEPRWFMRDQHMNPREALKAFADCGGEFALGHHYGTFQLTDEAIEAPVEALAAARLQAGVSAERFGLLRPGQVWDL